jgi:hypothetical protein
MNKSPKLTQQLNDPQMLAALHFFSPQKQRKIEQARIFMRKLWSRSLPPDFATERSFNDKNGVQYPHCAICQYFLPLDTWLSSPTANSERLPKTSRRYLTDQMFWKNREVDKQGFEIEEDELLKCACCRVVVHRRCYPTHRFKRRPPAPSQNATTSQKTTISKSSSAPSTSMKAQPEENARKAIIVSDEKVDGVAGEGCSTAVQRGRGNSSPSVGSQCMYFEAQTFYFTATFSGIFHAETKARSFYQLECSQ